MGDQPQRETVFQPDGSWVYRIPALLYQNQTFLAFAEQRRDKNDSHAKNLAMKTGNLKEDTSGVKTIEWSELKVVKEAKLEGYRSMNPCPVYDKAENTLFLFFTCVEGEVTERQQIDSNINKTRLCYTTSKDLGKTWDKTTDLTEELHEIKKWATFGVGPGHGLQTQSNTLIVPTYAHKERHPRALALYRDNSEWKFGKMLEDELLECEMAEFFDDEGTSFIYCNARTNKSYRAEAVSSAGCDFQKVSSKLIETTKYGGCQGSVVSFPAQDPKAQSDSDQSKNKWLLFSHPTDQSVRRELGVYLNTSPSKPSEWQDENWSDPWIINSGPSGYSDLAYIGDGWFACLFECGEKECDDQIASVVFHYTQVRKDSQKKVDQSEDRCCCLF